MMLTAAEFTPSQARQNLEECLVMSDSMWLAGGGSGGREEVSYVATPLFLVHILVLEIYGGCDGEVGVGGRKRFLKMLQGFRQEILKRKSFNAIL